MSAENGLGQNVRTNSLNRLKLYFIKEEVLIKYSCNLIKS